jgi:hypothetical protein
MAAAHRRDRIRDKASVAGSVKSPEFSPREVHREATAVVPGGARGQTGKGAASDGTGASQTELAGKRPFDLSWARLVRICPAVDVVDGLAKVVEEWVGSGDGMRSSERIMLAASPGSQTRRVRQSARSRYARLWHKGSSG